MERPISPSSSHSASSRAGSVHSDTFGLLNEKAKITVTRMPRLRSSWYIIGLICLGCVLADLTWQLMAHRSFARPVATLNEDVADYIGNTATVSRFEKPVDLRVIAFVFFTSRRKLSILECYLQQNLVSNGGMLDSVIFIPETGRESDLDWLNLLAHSHPAYRVDGTFAREGAGHLHTGWNIAWQLVRPGNLYIHISSEIVFIEPTAIASIIETRIQQPGYSAISANVINQPTMSWIHHHLGVVLPYRPEIKPLVRPVNTSATPRFDWRASDLPTWDGPKDFGVPADFGIPTDFQPPFNGHRWLPLRNNDTTLNPLTHETLDINGPGKWAWTTGALHHYSFLEHLEEKQLHRYKFPMWDFQHELLWPSMIAMWGKDIIDLRPMPPHDPDKWLSRDVPRKTGGRYPLVDGRALAVHFAHVKQVPGIPSTDLLERYKAYADENICR